jgi:hypothetical protein
MDEFVVFSLFVLPCAAYEVSVQAVVRVETLALEEKPVVCER